MSVINSGLKYLKEEINLKGETEKPNEIVKIVEKILKFNEQQQEWKGLKIIMPNQILSRLPISLAHLQARNNSQKLKNEIRQL